MDSFNISNWTRGSWEIFVPPTIPISGYRKHRKYQAIAIKEMEKHDHCILNAPTGSGKCQMIVSDIYYGLNNQEARRAIITVPQRVISAGFGTKEPIKFIDLKGNKCEFFIPKDLCQGNVTAGKVNDFISWLKDDTTVDNNRIILTSATFVAAFKKMKEANELDFFQDFIWWNDETHHEANDNETANQLAIISNYFFDNNRLVSQRKATATYYRMDGAAIIRNKDKFQTIRVDIEDYLRESSIQSININIGIVDSFDVGIKAIYKKECVPTIIFLPPVNSTSYNKFDLRDNCIKTIRKVNKKESFLDFVDPKQQKSSLDKLGNGEEYVADTLLCQEMLKEGANYTCAERAIVLGNRKSLLSIHHILGRLLRSTSSPKDVKLYILLERGLEQLSEDKVIENVNVHLTHLMLLMIGMDDFLPNSALQINKRKRTRTSVDTNLSYIDSIFSGDKVKQAEFQINVMKESWNYSTEELKDQFESIVERNLIKYGIEADVNKLSKEIWEKSKNKTFKFVYGDIKNIDVNLIDSIHPYEWGKVFVCKFAGPKWFENIRKYFGNNWRSFNKARDYIRSLKFQTYKDFIIWSSSGNRPSDIPSDPKKTYSSEFISTQDWVGIKPRNFLDYVSASDLAATIASTSVEYAKNYSTVEGLPARPQTFYVSEWNGFSEFLQNGKKKSSSFYNETWTYSSLSRFCIKQKITSANEYRDFRAQNSNYRLPSRPHKLSGFVSLGNMFGTGRVYKKDFFEFFHARNIIRNWVIANNWSDMSSAFLMEQMRRALSLNVFKNIPSHPMRFYKEWVSAPDWFGVERKHGCNFPSLEKAIETIKTIKPRIISTTEYVKLARQYNLPTSPYRVYKNFPGMKSYLGLI